MFGEKPKKRGILYEKKLKRSKDGLYRRYIGQNHRGVPEKFCLGYDSEEAEKRVGLIAALWQVRRQPYWTQENLETAKSIAKGESPILPLGRHENFGWYVERLNRARDATGVEFLPSDSFLFETGLDDIRRDIQEAQATLSKATGTSNATGRSVREAMDAYEAHVRRELTLPDEHLRPWGRTKLDQLASIRNYLSDKRFGGRDFLTLDLADLSYERCDDMYGVFRKRPLTLRSDLKKRMTPSTVKNLIKELGNLFDWLDGAEDYVWELPRRFKSIRRKPDELAPEETYQRRLAREKLVIPDDKLTILFEYALPIERLLLLLGLNCAFAASEIGQLRVGFLKLDQGIIDGIRFKTGNDTKHRLWAATRAGLEWWLARRRRIKVERTDHQDLVFLTDKGKPIWHGTKAGHVSDGVSNIWYRLVKRVRKDKPDFPSYSFNKLRKTAATRVLKIADAETASMVLAHKTIGEDELLHAYAQLPWEKLYAAQEQMEAELASVVAAGGPEPWAEKVKTYIGVARTKEIARLKAEGMPAPDIAERLGVSQATVYRLLAAKKEKPKAT